MTPAQYLAEANHFGKSLVLVRGDGHPDYASAAIYNSLDFRAEMPIFAWDRSPDTRARLLAVFPDRLVWIIDGPTLTHRGFEVSGRSAPAGKVAADVSSAPRANKRWYQFRHHSNDRAQRHGQVVRRNPRCGFRCIGLHRSLGGPHALPLRRRCLPDRSQQS